MDLVQATLNIGWFLAILTLSGILFQLYLHLYSPSFLLEEFDDISSSTTPYELHLPASMISNTRIDIQDCILTGTNVQTIDSSVPSIDRLPTDDPQPAFYLSDLIIKGSYASGYDGSNCTSDMILYILSRGVRFFDFQLFYAKDQWAVGYGMADSDNPGILSSLTALVFHDVCEVLVSNAFQLRVAPNPHDPLILHLRCNIDEDKAKRLQLQTSLSQTLTSVFGSKLWMKQTSTWSGTTLFGECRNKVIVVLHGPTTTWIEKQESWFVGRSMPIVNTITATSIPLVNTDTLEDLRIPLAEEEFTIPWQRPFSQTQFVIQIPTVDKEQTNTEEILHWKPNVWCLPFWKNNNDLSYMEQFFNSANSAFVPISRLHPNQ